MRTTILKGCLTLTALFAAGCTGIDFTICGTAEWEAKSRGADTTIDREIDVDFTTNKEFADSAKLFSKIELTKLEITVAEILDGNAAKSASGKVTVVPAAGGDAVEIGTWTGLEIAKDKTVSVTLSDAGKKLVAEALKAGEHKFKAHVIGKIDTAPAAVKLAGKFSVTATVGAGGIAKDLGCVDLSITTTEGSPATCADDSCSGHGTCTARENVLVCVCDETHEGLKCDREKANPNDCSPACAEGQHCVTEGTAHVCVADENPVECTPACSSDQHCEVIEGSPICVPNGSGDPCATVQCDTGFHCQPAENGPSCVPDGTSPGCGAGPACDPGFLCQNNQCVPMGPPCGSGPACFPGMICVDGQCMPDGPRCGFTGDGCIMDADCCSLFCDSNGTCG